MFIHNQSSTINRFLLINIHLQQSSFKICFTYLINEKSTIFSCRKYITTIRRRRKTSHRSIMTTLYFQWFLIEYAWIYSNETLITTCNYSLMVFKRIKISYASKLNTSHRKSSYFIPFFSIRNHTWVRFVLIAVRWIHHHCKFFWTDFTDYIFIIFLTDNNFDSSFSKYYSIKLCRWLTVIFSKPTFSFIKIYMAIICKCIQFLIMSIPCNFSNNCTMPFKSRSHFPCVCIVNVNEIIIIFVFVISSSYVLTTIWVF
jgi:hypothetical protein